MTEASAGLKTSKVLPEAAGTHLPAMRLRFGLASQAATLELTAGPEDFEEVWPFPLWERSAARLFLGRRTLVREAVVFITIKECWF